MHFGCLLSFNGGECFFGSESFFGFFDLVNLDFNFGIFSFCGETNDDIDRKENDGRNLEGTQENEEHTQGACEEHKCTEDRQHKSQNEKNSGDEPAKLFVLGF